MILFRKQKKCKYGLPSQSALGGGAGGGLHPGLSRAASMHHASTAYDGTNSGSNDAAYIYDTWASTRGGSGGVTTSSHQPEEESPLSPTPSPSPFDSATQLQPQQHKST